MPEKSSSIKNPASPGRQYYPALDGIRGIAILLVIVYHNFDFIEYTSFGWLGVDLFFVLSGFLITEVLLFTLGKPGFLGNFYARRALRIFPIYFLALIIFLLILPRLGWFPGSEFYVENQAWLWAYLQNWLFIFKGNDQTITLHHLWSLAVEEQFYLVWPLLVMLIKKPRTLAILMSFLLLTVILIRLWIWEFEIADLSYYRLYTFTRIDGLCIGSIVALMRWIDPGILKRNTTMIVLGFALLNFAFFFINRNNEFSFPYLALVGYTSFAMVFGILVNEAAAPGTSLLIKLLGAGVLRFFGRISYGLYIIHWPLYVLWKPRLTSWVEMNLPSMRSPFIVSLVATLAAVALAWLSFRFFESYFLRIKKKFS